MPGELGLVLQVAVGLVFILSSAAKLSDFSGFVDGIKRYDLLPESSAAAASAIVLVAEAVLGVSHVLGILLNATVPIAIAMLLGFAVVVGRAISRGDDVPCLCFGSGSTELASARTVARLGALIAAEALIWLSLSADARAVRTSITWSDVTFAISAAGLVLVLVSWILVVTDVYRLHKANMWRGVCLKHQPNRKQRRPSSA